MKLPSLRESILPLALLGFAGAATAFLPASIFGLGRWVGASVLLVYVVSAGFVLRSTKPVSLLLIVPYVGWCLFTTAWSLVPELSIAKSLALACVLPAFLLGGIDWAVRRRDGNYLGFLWPFVLLAIGAAVLGREVAVPDSTQEFELYQGAAGGPNILGVFTASSTPVALWYLYRDWSLPRRRVIWLGLLGFFLVYLYLSTSRASYLLFAGVAGGFYLSLRPKAAVPLLGTLVAAILSVVVVAPDFAESLVQRNVYKYGETESGVFANREREWEESYDAAIDGGWQGLGYGVSTGDSEFFGGYTSVGYGREKGNSQLAVIEETGIIGLALLLMLMLAIFLELWSAFWLTRDPNLRMQLGLLLGSFVGVNIHGIFEAWWVAPGSVEFAYLWAVAGVGLGLAHTIRARRTDPRLGYRNQPLRV